MTDAETRSFSVKDLVSRIGIPTLIIAAFWIITLILGVIKGESLSVLFSDTIRRFGMNGVLVLAMVPSIQSGTGPNFALPVGIICGLLGIVCTIALGFTGWMWLLMSAVIGSVFAIIAGYIYGLLMNAVKGSEMTIATYTGFSITALACIGWLVIPFNSSKMKWFIGDGLRETVQLSAVGGAQILSDTPLSFYIGDVHIPTVTLLVFFAFCFLVFLFFRSKTGIAISAGGINPLFAQASGLNIDRSRVIANVLSTVLAAIGIIIYSQSYGYAQLYLGPLKMAFPAVAAVLIGGATAQRAKVSHAIIGTLLFQGLMTTALPVANRFFPDTDLSETIRMVVQNGIILYALAQVRKEGGK